MTTRRTEIVARVDGRDIPTSFHLGRCEGERLIRCEGGGAGYNGNWKRIQGCDLAFFFRLRSRAVNASVTCPGCGLSLDTTTRRLRAGFLPLSDDDVVAIQASAGRAVDVSCLSPIAEVEVIVDTVVTRPGGTLPQAPDPRPAPNIQDAIKAVAEARRVQAEAQSAILRFIRAGGDPYGPEAEALRERRSAGWRAVSEAEKALTAARKAAKLAKQGLR